MKFYCLYDLIEHRRREIGQTEQEMFNFFRHEKVKKSELLFYKNNCSVEQADYILPAIEKYTGLSKLEIYLSIGIVPEEYKDNFFKNIHLISKILEKDQIKKENIKLELKPFFETKLGVLYNDDCIEVLSQIPDKSVDLVFADPPFNLNKIYDEGINDCHSMTEYLEWCFKWIEECIRILKRGGALFVYNIPKWSIFFSDYLNKRMTLRSWIAIDMKLSFPIKGRLYPSHYGLLYYIKGDKPNTFNTQRMPIQTCRHCGGEIKDYGGYKKKMNPNGVNISDVWTDIYPVRHKKQKNRAFNELSVKMLDRVISMTTNPGDVVFDPFGGSGTTYVVSELLERKWIGSELGNCNIIEERFKTIQKDKELLQKIYEDKNTIFSRKSRILRSQNGFWLDDNIKS